MTDMTGRGRSQATRGRGIRRANISKTSTPDSPMTVTPLSTLPAPHSFSPVLDTMSLTPVDSQTHVAPSEAVSSTTTSMFLTFCLALEFRLYLEACAAISITKDFKAHFCGTQTQWSHLDDEFVDLLYQCFLDRDQYEETVDPKEARKVWVRRAMERCRCT
ncbi:hypothetical protein Tco_1072547 [Tanacetum coccineum]